MDISIYVFFAISALVAVDFGLSGYRLYGLSRHADGVHRPFIQGIAMLLMTISVTNAFWLMLVIVTLRVNITGLGQHVAVALIVIIGTAAVIGRRRWWSQILLPAVKNGADEES